MPFCMFLKMGANGEAYLKNMAIGIPYTFAYGDGHEREYYRKPLCYCRKKESYKSLYKSYRLILRVSRFIPMEQAL